MVKLTDAINTFKTGDLVFTRYPVKPGGQPIHLTMFLDGTAPQGLGYVHAGKTQLEIAKIATYADDKDSGGYLRVFCADAQVRTAIAEVAAIFAAGAPKTPYGDFPSNKDWLDTTQGVKLNASRFTGMIRTTTVAEIPFEFAALHRLLKWTHRAITGEAFSDRRGITCAAFGSACVQVAGMRAFLGEFGIVKNPTVLADCLEKLRGMVVTKDFLRDGKLTKFEKSDGQKTTTYYQDQAARANSNRVLSDKGKGQLQGMMTYQDGQKHFAQGWLKDAMQTLGVTDMTGLSAVERAWLAIQCQMLKIDPYLVRKLSGIIDPSFYFDAKYVSSVALSRIFPTGNWNSTEYTEY